MGEGLMLLSIIEDIIMGRGVGTGGEGGGYRTPRIQKYGGLSMFCPPP